MRHLCVVGLQWGDEGKGKVVDVLSRDVDAVVRYQGGANAGHTVHFDGQRHVIHHLPTAVFRPDLLAVLGNGMVIEPSTLLDEVGRLEDRLGDGFIERLAISDRAHLVLPQHRLLDRQRETASAHPIGTTLRGIGPAYEDKVGRRGLRTGDLCAPGALDHELPRRLSAAGVTGAALEEGLACCRRFLERLGPRIVDTRALLDRLHAEGRRLLFEGAQGVLLDLDFGTYPFVTSSSPGLLGLGPGTGFSPRRVQHVLGVTKAYCTRVGEGPFPTELESVEADELRRAGGEFGSTTGRPRRCGWLDLPALRYALAVSDVDSIALTKADILNGRARVPVAVAYRWRGRTLTDELPLRAEEWADIEPVYEDWPGWETATEEAMGPFLERLERALDRPVSMLSSGPGREEVVLRPPLTPAHEGAA